MEYSEYKNVHRTYQPPRVELNYEKIISKIKHDGEICVKKKGENKSYFQISTTKGIFSYEFDEDFNKIDEWINNHLKDTNKNSSIFIWSGSEFTILYTHFYNYKGTPTPLYNYKGPQGFFIREKYDIIDIKENEKIYSEKEILNFINNLSSDYILVNNIIEASLHDMKKFTTSKELWNKRKVY